MNFIIDANLPAHLIHVFRQAGHEAIHSTAIHHAMTPDEVIGVWADENDHIVFTRDRGFINRHFAGGSPSKAVWLSGPNMKKPEMASLIQGYLPMVTVMLGSHPCVELNRNGPKPLTQPPD